jgi:hypothetical protein
MKLGPLILVCLLAAMGSCLSARSIPEQGAAVGEIVRLSPYEVWARSIEFEKWIKVSSPHFVVYTDATLSETQALLRRLEMVRLAVARLMQRPIPGTIPMRLVLPTASSDWRKLEHKGEIEWSAAVSLTDTLTQFMMVQVDWQRHDSAVLLGPVVFMQLRLMNPGNQLWFNQGVALYFETAKFKEHTVVLGEGNPRMMGLTQGWMPWSKFFAVTRHSPEYLEHHQIDRYLGQCAAFMHHTLSNPDPVWREWTMTWAGLLDAGYAPSEELFKRTFGIEGWKQWERTINLYLRRGRFTQHKIVMDGTTGDFATVSHDLPVQEMRELFVLAQVINQATPDGKTSFEALVRKGIKSADLRDLLVEACMKWERESLADELMDQLIAEHSPNATVYSLRAQRRLAWNLPRISVGSRLPQDEAGAIRSLCQQALVLDPLGVETLNTLVWAEALGEQIGSVNVEAIKQAYHTAKGRMTFDQIMAALAVAHWRLGDEATARMLGQKLLDSPFTGADMRKLVVEISGNAVTSMPSQRE